MSVSVVESVLIMTSHRDFLASLNKLSIAPKDYKYNHVKPSAQVEDMVTDKDEVVPKPQPQAEVSDFQWVLVLCTC